MRSNVRDILSPHMMIGLEGTSLTAAERGMLASDPPAGVILFDRNVESMEQLRRLASEVFSIIEASSGAPPLIAADHEGGRISVLARAIGAPPSQRACWKPRSKNLLRHMTARNSRLLRACGINLILAPVADVNSEPLNPVIGTRSFAGDDDGVAVAVRTAVRAYSEAGLLCCLKHFPGHGSSAGDSHLTLPVLGRDLENGARGQLWPFAAGIEEGADTVMTAHVATVPGGPPASLDMEVIEGLLRKVLGFGGVVITDALEMAGALPDGLPMKSIDPVAGAGKKRRACPAAVAAAALSAGNDILLMSRPIAEVFAEIEECSTDLVRIISDGRLAGLISDSAARIQGLRAGALSPGPLPETGEAGTAAGTESSLEVEEEIAAAAVETVSGVAGAGGHITEVLPVPSFLGEMRDFDSPVVRRFILGILEAIRGQGAGRGRKIDTFRGRPDLEPLDEGAGDTGLYIYRPWKEKGPGGVLVLLMRRPFGSEVLRSAAEGYGVVIAAGRPWDAEPIRKGRKVIVTEGIYDAAAGAAVRLI